MIGSFGPLKHDWELAELEKEYQDYLKDEAERVDDINRARQMLESLRKRTYEFDVHCNSFWQPETEYDIEEIRFCLLRADATLANVGTNEEELANLMRMGYKNEASHRLEMARTRESSGYVQDVKEAIFCFKRSPDYRLLKNLLQVVLLIEPYRDCRQETSEMLRLLEEAKIPMSEIGTTKKELSRLRYPFFLRYLF